MSKLGPLIYLPMPLVRVVELTGDTTPDIRAIEQADVIVTTPELARSGTGSAGAGRTGGINLVMAR